MKILLIGAGEVGSHLAETLSNAGHEVTVIEKNASLCGRIQEEMDVRAIHGTGSSAATLKKANVGGCDFFLAMTSDDETNLVSASLAKVMGARTTFARVHDQTYRDTTILNYQKHFHIDHLLNPERLAAVAMAKVIRNPGRVAVEDFGRGQIEVQSLLVKPRSKVIGRPLSELNLGHGVRVGLVQRGETSSVPTARTVLEAGDQVTLFGTTDSFFEALPRFDPGSSDSRNISVTIMGGGEIAVSLIRLLKRNYFKLRLIERDPVRARVLAEQFSHVNVILGEATSLRLLQEEQVGSTDFFVACTRDDEDNIMTCLQAHKLGVPHNLLAINRPDYLEILTQLKDVMGIELAVSPRLSTADEVLRFVTKKPYIEMATLPDKQNTIIEVRVLAGSHCEGRRLRDIPWPPDCVVVGLEHDYVVKTPGADDRVHASDWLVVILRREYIPKLLELAR